MERISSMLFSIALIVYYLPKILKIKSRKYVKAHIFIGSISILAMIVEVITKIGQADFIKYLGFSFIMIMIGLTGYLIKKKPKLYRRLHLIFTILFFVYLFVMIKFF